MRGSCENIFTHAVSIVVRVKCNMSANWTDREVFRLINCWSEEGIQEQLEDSRRNKHVYDKLSRSLAEHDIKKTGEQCRTKVKKIRQEYKKFKDNHNLTGRGSIQWKYFKKLDKIFGTRPATRPQVLLDYLYLCEADMVW